MDFAALARHASGTHFWLLTGWLGALAVTGLVRAFILLLRARVIEDLPTSRIRSAAQGYVELEGRCELMPGPPILSPLTGSRCVWYEYSIHERRGSDRNSRWVRVESGRSSDLFLLTDATGECVIDPDGARVTPAITKRWYGPNLDSRPKTTGTRWPGLGARYRFREARLRPGDPLYAIGLFETVNAGAGHAADPQAMLKSLLREWKADGDALLERFDRDRDGAICLEEWEAVRAAAWQEVRVRHAELQAADPVHLLSDTRDARRPYLLSALSQSDLVRRCRRGIAVWSALALAGSSLTAWLLVTRFGG